MDYANIVTKRLQRRNLHDLPAVDVHDAGVFEFSDEFPEIVGVAMENESRFFALDPRTQTLETVVRGVVVVVYPPRRAMGNEDVDLGYRRHHRRTVFLSGHHGAFLVFDAPLVSEERNPLHRDQFHVQVLDSELVHVPAVAMVAVHADFGNPVYFRQFGYVAFFEVAERDDEIDAPDSGGWFPELGGSALRLRRWGISSDSGDYFVFSLAWVAQKSRNIGISCECKEIVQNFHQRRS